MKFRLLLVGLIFLFDVLILPTLMYVFSLILKGVPVLVHPNVGPARVFTDQFVFLWDVPGTDFAKGYYIMQVAVVGLSIITLWKEQKGIEYKMSNGIGGPPAAGKGQFGTARWQTHKEFDQSNTVWNMKELPKKGGLILGADLEKSKAWTVSEDEHAVIIGATASGKSRKIILPTIWNLGLAGESMLITDPKGELYENTKLFLEKQGYEVVMIDFRDPRQSTHHWNPMEQVVKAIKNGDVSKASEVAWNIAHMIVHQKQHSGDPIWANGQESVIAALILYVATEAKNDNEKHLASVYQLIVEYSQTRKRDTFNGPEEYVPLIDLMNDLPPGHIAKNAFATAAIAPERTRGSFFSGVAADLRLFSDPAVSYLTSFQDHNLDDLGKRKTATFLIIPDEVKTRHFLAALYVDQTYLKLVEYAATTPNGRINVRTQFLLDEFGNMPKITDFDSKITVSRSRGILFRIVIQGLDQIKEKYDKLADTITGNCRVWIYILTNDNNTAKIISTKLGKYTIQNQSFSSSAKVYDTSASHSLNLTGRDLLTPDEIMRYPNTHAMVLRASMLPGQVLTPDISKYPVQFKKIERGEYQAKDMGYRIFNPFEVAKVTTVMTEDVELAFNESATTVDSIPEDNGKVELETTNESNEEKTSYMNLI